MERCFDGEYCCSCSPAPCENLRDVALKAKTSFICIAFDFLRRTETAWKSAKIRAWRTPLKVLRTIWAKQLKDQSGISGSAAASPQKSFFLVILGTPSKRPEISCTKEVPKLCFSSCAMSLSHYIHSPKESADTTTQVSCQ